MGSWLAMKRQAANKRANKATLRFMAEPAGETTNYTVARVTRRVPDTLAGLRLDKALARMFPEHSRNRLQRWLKDGHVSLDSHAAKPKQKIWGGERVEIRSQPGPADTAFRPEPIALDVVYEDDDVLVINKAAGLVVHPGSGNWKGTLLNALLHRAPQLAAIPRAGIVHRLDKDTSGLLVVAKTLRAHTELVRQLQAKTVKRHDDPRTPQLRRQALHAIRLGFSHPVSGALKRFSVPLPEDLRSLLDSLE